MKEEAREYYYFLLTVCQDENIPLVTVYLQLFQGLAANAVQRLAQVGSLFYIGIL